MADVEPQAGPEIAQRPEGETGQARPASNAAPNAAPKIAGVIWVLLGVCSGLAIAAGAWLLIDPGPGPPPAFPYQDKVYHVIAFCLMAGPAALALPARYLPFWMTHMLAFGAGIEIVQAKLIEGRQGSFYDFLADLVGVVLAAIIGQTARRIFVSLRGG
ncbi:MAG: hypothetical protein R3C52_12095 [Hyphomonadaceae bacterium]